MLLAVNPMPDSGRLFKPGEITLDTGPAGGGAPGAALPLPPAPDAAVAVTLCVGRCATLGPRMILGPVGRGPVGVAEGVVLPNEASRRRDEEIEGVLEGGSEGLRVGEFEEGLRAGGDVPRAEAVPVGVRRPALPVGVLRPLGGGDVAGGEVAVLGGGELEVGMGVG